MFDLSNAEDRMALSQAVLIGSLVVACLWETIAPYRPVSVHTMWRWLNNLLLAACNQVALLLLLPVLYASLITSLDWQPYGLLQRIHVHPAMAVVVVVLAIEAVGYTMHRLHHAIPLLWRWHAVHHSDTEVDFSTAHRHHLLEVLLNSIATLPILMLLGPDIQVLVGAQVLIAVVTAVSHANVSFGPRVNRWLRWIVVTPDFHRVHHSSDVRFTNSHYATVIPLFDHLLGTAHAADKTPGVHAELGLEYFREPRYIRLDRLLSMPLACRQKDQTLITAPDLKNKP